MDYLHKVWILTLSWQSMDCLLNPGLSMLKIWMGQFMDCPHILGTSGLSAQSTDLGNQWIAPISKD